MDISSVGNGAKGNEKYNVGPMDFRQSTGMDDACQCAHFGDIYLRLSRLG